MLSRGLGFCPLSLAHLETNLICSLNLALLSALRLLSNKKMQVSNRAGDNFKPNK